MKYFIKSLCLLFLSSLFFGCSIDNTVDIDRRGGPDPLSYRYTYLTKWVSFEKLNGDGKWETINNKDTLQLYFDYDSEANLISESNGVYMVNNRFLESNIIKLGYFRSSNNIFTFMYKNNTDQSEEKRSFSFSNLETNTGNVGDIITFTDEETNPIRAVKFKSIEYKKVN